MRFQRWVVGTVSCVALMLASCRVDDFSGSIDSSGSSWKTHPFQVTSAEVLSVVLDWSRSSVDLNLFILDPSGVTVATANTASARPERLTYVTTKPGTWSIAVKAKTGGYTTYHITLARQPVPTSPKRDWKLAFADEFNGTSVDSTKWKVYDEARGDSVESPKASTCPLASNVSVSGGKLIMRTQKSGGRCKGGQAQSGAGLNTWGKFEQAGGRFVARVRWTHKGNYLWGGFWSSGNNKTFSKNNASEIDFFEYIAKTTDPNMNRFKPAIHYNYTCDGTCRYQNMQFYPIDVTAWHEYAVEWDPTDPKNLQTMQIRFYLDSVLITIFDKSGMWRVARDGSKKLEIVGGWKNPAGPFPNPFGLDRLHRINLSAWVGAPGVSASEVANGYRPSGGHADLEVDYVRVYKR